MKPPTGSYKELGTFVHVLAPCLGATKDGVAEPFDVATSRVQNMRELIFRVSLHISIAGT